MAKWYVKDLSRLTGISTQTLHYYDKIDLLKPSLRESNNYRLYSKKDLLRLEHIIALKFFGFTLSQIKKLLQNDTEIIKHFRVQSKILKNKAQNLLEASKTLEKAITMLKNNETIRSETIVKLIKGYTMSQQLEHTWVKEIFTPEELAEYTAFETEWKKNTTSKQKAEFERNWSHLIKEVQESLTKDPHSQIGIALGRKWMNLINTLYGKKYAHLRTKKFEQGFAKGKGLKDVGLTPEIVSWIDKAFDAYWQERISLVLNKIGTETDEIVFKLFNEVLDEICGYDNKSKKEVFFLP